MLLLEHHGKALLRKYGIPTPRGAVARDESALAATLRDPPGRVVLKAQIASGGRGKNGGIAFAANPAEVRAAFRDLRSKRIGGQAVDAVLIEECIAFGQERYAGILLQDGEIRLLFARHGGIDIEDVTAADESNLYSFAIDPVAGPGAAQFRDCFARLGYATEYHAAYERIGRALFALCRESDATMVEINPLVQLGDGRLLALDARILVDDAALGRQPEIATLQPSPSKASRLPFRENPEGGAIGVIGLGGGLNVTLMDWLADGGAKVAALVDIDEAIGAGRAAQGFAAAFETFDRHPGIRAILVNVITCGYRLDDITAGLAAALARRDAAQAKPAVLHLRGNAMLRTPELLRAAGLVNSASLAAAVAGVIAAAQS